MNTRGFTIIELLMYIAITPLIVLAISGFAFALLQSREKNQTIAEVEQQGAEVTRIITQSIRNAEAINTPPPGGTAPLLSLDVVNVASDPTLFDIAGSAIRIQEGSASPALLTNARVIVSDISFQNISRTDTPGIIRTQFTISHINPKNRYEYAFTKTFYGSASIRY